MPSARPASKIPRVHYRLEFVRGRWTLGRNDRRIPDGTWAGFPAALRAAITRARLHARGASLTVVNYGTLRQTYHFPPARRLSVVRQR